MLFNIFIFVKKIENTIFAEILNIVAKISERYNLQGQNFRETFPEILPKLSVLQH